MTCTVAFDPGASLTGMGEQELLGALRELEVHERRLYAARLRVIAELDARGVGEARGYGGIGGLVREVGQHNPGTVRRLVAQAQALNATITPTGAVLEPELPRTAQALADGLVGSEHVEAIRGALEALPRGISDEEREAAERILVDAAVSSEPRIVARLGREIRARLDPDGAAPRDKDLARPDRWLELRSKPDGSVTGMFGLDPEAGALLTNLLSPHTAPQSDEQGLVRRGRDERQGDGLVEVLRLAARSPEVPTEAGEPVTLLVSIPLTELETRLDSHGGRGLVDGHLPLPVAQVRRMACDAKVIPTVLGSQSEPLDIGRSARTVPRALRRALIHRDAGCSFPGCDRNAKWCQAHHVVHWADGGPTSLDNLALVCARHHRVLHHTGWDVQMINGRPWYRPPAHLDPDRTPQRNTLHTHRTTATAPPSPRRPSATGTRDAATSAAPPWELNPWTRARTTSQAVG